MLTKIESAKLIVGVARSLERIESVTSFRITCEGVFIDLTRPTELKNFLDNLLTYSLEYSFPTITYRSEQFYTELEADTFTCGFAYELPASVVEFFKELTY